MERYDIAVIGLGGIGSAAAWFAARSAKSVVGIERFDLGGHHHGASHDHSRIIRHSYHTEHYVQLTSLAYDAWRDVEGATGETIVHTTGGIDLFPRNAAIDIDTYRESMRSCAIDFDELTAADVMGRWPAWRLDAEVDVLYQANTGIVSPAVTVPLLQRLASDSGAVLHGNATVVAIEPDRDDARIHLDDGRVLRASNVVIAADAWTAELVEPLAVKLPLTVTREQVTYYESDAPRLFAPDRFPVWIWMDDPSFYGFPTFGRPGVKIAQDCGGQPVDPNRRGFDPDSAILERTATFASRMFPGHLGRALSTTTCLYTLTPDRDFVVDALPDHPNIHVALGAGHGYKFAAWFGKTLAALASEEEPACDLSPFRLARPALTDPTWEPNWLV